MITTWFENLVLLILNMIDSVAALNLAARPVEAVRVVAVASPGRLMEFPGQRRARLCRQAWPPLRQQADSVLLQ